MSASTSWTPERIPDLSGRNILITGANSGLGLETARLLAGRGAKVVMACRSPEKGEAAMADIRGDHPQADLVLMQLDLADLDSVRDFAGRFRQGFDRLDVLVNNAGLMAPPLQRTKQGFEIQFGTNHLGHFALTGLLLEPLQAAGRSRVVSVSSVGHRMGDMDFANLNAEKRYRRWLFYGRSKLANLMFALELHRRCRRAGLGVESVAVPPGFTATELQRFVPGRRVFNALLSQPQHMGAWPLAFGAVAEEAESGGYYGPKGFMELHGAPAPAYIRPLAKKKDVADRLWRVSEEMTGVAYLDGA